MMYLVSLWKAFFNLRIAGFYHENSLLCGMESGRKGAAEILDAGHSNLRQLTNLAGTRMDLQNPTSFREQ